MIKFVTELKKEDFQNGKRVYRKVLWRSSVFIMCNDRFPLLCDMLEILLMSNRS